MPQCQGHANQQERDQNPALIKQILNQQDEIESLRKDRDMWRKKAFEQELSLDDYEKRFDSKENERMRMMINQLEEKIDALKIDQEPVAWMHPMDLGRFGSVTFNRDSEEQIPLYTHPVVSSEPVASVKTQYEIDRENQHRFSMTQFEEVCKGTNCNSSKAMPYHSQECMAEHESCHATVDPVDPVGYVTDSGMSAWIQAGIGLEDGTPLYLHPSRHLSDEEILAIAKEHGVNYNWPNVGHIVIAFARKVLEKANG